MFSPARLTLARLRRGMTKTTLAQSASVTPRIISAYESGDNEPSSKTIWRLAAALDFPVEFFYRDGIEPVGVHAASFRALSKMTASQSGAARAAGALCLELEAWIGERFTLPAPDVIAVDPALRDPEAGALMVRRDWGLGEMPIPNLIHLMEAHGIRVFSLAEECREVDAFSFWNEMGTPFVCLNTVKTAEHSRFDAAHELGHLVMHHGHSATRGREEEQEAQAFAAAFLMPSADIKSRVPHRLSWDQLIVAKKRWNVSAAALNFRLGKMGHITEWNYRELCIAISRYGRQHEPNPGQREHSQLLGKVFSSLREEGLSRSDIAKELSITQNDLDVLVFGLVVSSIDGGGQTTERATPRFRVVR